VSDADILARLAQTIESRKGVTAGDSYVASLFTKGLDAMLKKVGEEATEIVLAAKDGDAEHLVREVADLWFHTLVVLAYMDRGPAHVLAELARREGTSGMLEKAARPLGEKAYSDAEKPFGKG
jgi:phosphoribosyl-ATP pyrophosphohydrolase